MAITFHCPHCQHEVQAPDGAAGRLGKCPRCGETSRIPEAEAEDDLIPLAPLDEEEERRGEREARALYEQEQALIDESGGPVSIPLDQRDDLSSEDLHHFVVNYCLDMADGKLQRADQYVQQLRRFGLLAMEAVDDFINGMAAEPAMDHIPRPVLQGFFRELRAQVT